MIDTKELGRIAYNAYCDEVGWKAFNGDSLLEFDDLPDRIRNAWIRSADEVKTRIALSILEEWRRICFGGDV